MEIIMDAFAETALVGLAERIASAESVIRRFVVDFPAEVRCPAVEWKKVEEVRETACTDHRNT